MAVDVGECEVYFLVVGFKRQQVLEPGDRLNVLACAGQNLGFSKLEGDAFRVQPDGVVVHLLRFSNRAFLQEMLDQPLQFIVVEKLGFTRFHHGFKSLDQRVKLLFFLMSTSLVLHATQSTRQMSEESFRTGGLLNTDPGKMNIGELGPRVTLRPC